MSRLDSSSDGRLRRCRNHADYGNCNWVLRGDDPFDLCFSCGANQIIPDVGRPDNLMLWTRIEQAKRRLMYTLLDLRLVSSVGPMDLRPAFRFLEDRFRNPNVLDDFVPTGHEGGVITLNLAEADDTARQFQRQQFHERYRTVLGHLRHEAGHFFFGHLTKAAADLDACRRIFGDERLNYSDALRAHYEVGPPDDWPARHLSSYASAHPREDFAESFAHYLLIVDTLQTVRAAGLDPVNEEAHWIHGWIDVAIELNELSRSLGADDAYPFVLTPPVIEKLELIDRLVRGGGTAPRVA
jgi:hypothetical protein